MKISQTVSQVASFHFQTLAKNIKVNIIYSKCNAIFNLQRIFVLQTMQKLQVDEIQ
jgi:hypothetical protein